MTTPTHFEVQLADSLTGAHLAVRGDYLHVSGHGSSQPVSLEHLKAFVALLGGNLTLPGTLPQPKVPNSTQTEVRLGHLSVDIFGPSGKIGAIKALRESFIVGKGLGKGTTTLGLKAAKEMVEAAMAGGEPLVFTGTQEEASQVMDKLLMNGFDRVVLK